MRKPMAPSSAIKNAELLKQEAKTCFCKGRYGAAIEAYTQAITLCPEMAVLWTNRALCYRKKGEWTRVEEDCRRALELDRTSVKGHYMLGLSLLEKEDYDEGVNALEKAFSLGKNEDPKSYIVEEIWQELAKAKYLAWDHAASLRSWRMQALKDDCEKALRAKHFYDSSPGVDGSNYESSANLEERIEFLAEVFRKASEDDIPFEVPDYLCCKISLDIFRDPVITPSGVSYEKSVLLEHLRKVGKFDPITREPLDEHQLIPNLAIKQAVQAFLNEHGWAYKNT